MKLLLYFLSLVFILIFLVIFLYNIMFVGFFRLPKFFEEKVYSFYYTKENYPEPQNYSLSSSSYIYNVQNPFDKIVSSFLYSPSQKSPSSVNKPLLIYFRGNGGIEFRMKAISRIQNDNDIDIILINYRGSFKEMNASHPRRFNIKSDNEFQWKCIKQLFGDRPYYVYGLSIGSAIATDFIYNRIVIDRDYNLQGVILDNIFTDLASSFLYSGQNANSTLKKIPKWVLNIFSRSLLSITGEVYNNVKSWKRIVNSNITFKSLILSSSLDQVMDPDDGKKISDLIPFSNFKLINRDHGSNSDDDEFYVEINKILRV